MSSSGIDAAPDRQYQYNEKSGNSFPFTSPFGDSNKASPQSSVTGLAAPALTLSAAPSSSDLTQHGGRGKYPFKSYRLKGAYEQPWRDDPRMKRTLVNNWIIRVFMVLGIIFSGIICYFKAMEVNRAAYCLVFEDNFETLDTSVWTHEVQIDGFGNGAFDWTTTDPLNSYVDSEGLHIIPTLTNETTKYNNDLLYNGGTLNLTKAGGDGSCTGTTAIECSISSNATLGAMIPPVRSARLTTKGTKSLKYGRVEVVAKMPTGDWLWPAIWMMPVNSVYGVWPRSGEIDIAESRGNDVTYPEGGKDTATSTLHWGPVPGLDTFWKTTAGKLLRRTDFTKTFHTFGIEWSEGYLYTYLDSRIIQVLFVGFEKEKLWDLGNFADMAQANSTLFTDPWAKGGQNAPFDQDFYLILNVAVGGTNGWFKDHVGGKPWLDAATNAQWDFYSTVDTWLPTWGMGADRGMTVKSVKMWSQGACK